MNESNLLRAIEAAIAVIGKEQLSDGGFSHSSGGEKYTTTFFTANILSCLNSVQALNSSINYSISGLATVRENAARFLLAQKSEYWSFNYWTRGSREMESLPYPDDLDDTFVALAALYGWDVALIDGDVFACVARMLTALEIAPGGPYRTWLISPDARSEWRDVDIAVNANVSYFLSLVDISLPNLSRFIDERIQQRNLLSAYYPNIAQSIYFISRFYRGDGRATLADALLFDVRQNPFRRNPLECAMAVSALINLGFAEKISPDAIRLLTEAWPSSAFCLDPARDGKRQVAGSPALTAAFCAEALAKLETLAKFVKTTPPSSPDVPPAALEKIQAIARTRCAALPEELKTVILAAIEAIKDNEIVMVPYVAYASVRKQNDIPARLLDELALANLYGWIAYSIYDDFFDGEVSLGGGIVVQKLSVANYFLRELTLSYATLDCEIPGICDKFVEILNLIDVANVQEQTRGNVFVSGPEVLADRSLGHALPALGVFMAAGVKPDSFGVAAPILFFKNYLAARQLHDDAHDWKEDLRRGRMNGAAVRMFAMRQDVAPVPDDLPAQLRELQKFFWRVAIPRIVGDILDFLNEARIALATIEIIEDPAPFEILLLRLEIAAQQTLYERDEAMKFLDLYLSAA